MTLWRRAPRSVYEVYDEEGYLSGEGEPIGGPESADESFGQTAVSQTAVSCKDSRTVRLFALGLLSVVTVSAAAIVAVGVSRHPNAPALGVARRDGVYPTRPSAGRSGWIPRTHTTVKAAAVSAIAASAAPQVHPRVGGYSHSILRQQGFARGRPYVVYAATAEIQASSDAAGKAVWGTGESSFTSEARIDGEFGFER